MHRLFNQIYHVVLVYALRPRSWLWIGLIGLMMIVGLWAFEGGNTIFGFYYGMWVAVLLNDHMAIQFAHYRAKVIPGFRIPHLAVPAVFCVVTILLVPAFFAWSGGHSLWEWTAVTSSWFAVMILIRHYSVLSWIFLVVIIGPLFFGKSITNLQIELSPLAYAGIVIGDWIFIAFHFMWYAKLREDLPSYKKAIDQAMLSTAADADSQNVRPSESGFNQLSRWVRVADWWHDRIGRHRGHRSIPIVRLLRYGFGPNPTEFQAVLSALGIVLFLSFISFRAFSAGEETDVPQNIWIFVALFSTLLPSAQAAVELGQRRKFLAAELMRPLSRDQLIGGLFLASGWNAGISWLFSNGALIIVLYLLPDKHVTLMFVLTYMLLSASMAATMFGLALFDIKFVSAVERILFLMFVLLVCIGVFGCWWGTRNETGDIPFWIAAAAFFAFAKVLVGSARKTWLNLEFGNTNLAK
jgi:hypothetical protein